MNLEGTYSLFTGMLYAQQKICWSEAPGTILSLLSCCDFETINLRSA